MSFEGDDDDALDNDEFVHGDDDGDRLDGLVRAVLEPGRGRVVIGAWRVDRPGDALPSYVVHAKLGAVGAIMGMFYQVAALAKCPVTFHVGDPVSVTQPMPPLPKHARPLWAPVVRLVPRR